jgi:penicillin-binding protein 1A
MSDGTIDVAGWKPRNYKRTFEGKVKLIDAMARSINTVAVRVAERAGVRRVIETAKRYGMTADFKADLGLALGTSEVTMLELTAGYASFANGGYGVWPYAIKEIHDNQGEVLYKRQGGGPGRIEPVEKIAAMNKMLTAVIERGTGKNARINRDAAGKSGTSQNYRDAWFIGYTADRVAAVWVGNDNGTVMNKVTGGGLPALMWRDLITLAHRDVSGRKLIGVEALPIISNENPAAEIGAWQVLKNIFNSD